MGKETGRLAKNLRSLRKLFTMTKGNINFVETIQREFHPNRKVAPGFA